MHVKWLKKCTNKTYLEKDLTSLVKVGIGVLTASDLL